MNFSLVPMPACEELAMGYVPSNSSSRPTGEPVSFRVIAALYLFALLAIFMFASETSSPDVQTKSVSAAAPSAASCPDCTRMPLSPSQPKD
jgi:hypothetical protein